MNASPAGLEALRDIHLPEALSWWPPAAGWWGVAVVLLALGALVTWQLRRRRMRRHALRELARIEAEFTACTDRVRLAGALSALLRRVALARFERTRVAALHGEAWIACLCEASQRLSPALARELLEELYAGGRGERRSGAPEEWLAATRGWIREVA
jgi:hypothetical protein